MFIFITVGILLLTAFVLLIFQITLPDFRFAWLVAAGGALVAWVSVFIWQAGMPIIVQLPLWQPALIFPQSPLFVADGIFWEGSLSARIRVLGLHQHKVSLGRFPDQAEKASVKESQ